MKAAASQPRRTQAERRAATQTALLDATIDCLVEYGYAGTTTVRIVERAGVSRGAQVHHYSTKADLVAAAVLHLAEKRMAEFVRDVELKPPTTRPEFDRILNRAWEVHTSPLFAASMEMLVAARTDPDLRAQMLAVERDVNRAVAAGLTNLVPLQARDKRFRETLELGLAAMRGLAIMGFVDPGPGVARRWKKMQGHLLELIPEPVES